MWAALLAGAAGCYGLKVVGLSIPRSWLDRPTVQRLAALLPVALLAALAAVQTSTSGDRVVADARMAGVAVGIAAIVLRAPFLVVVASAAATAALLRAFGWP
jgi:hypothetical protein